MKKSVALIAGLAACAGSLLSPAGAHAQDVGDEVLRCGAIADDGARLRCYDALLPKTRQSAAERRAEAEAKAKADFGLTAVQRSEKVKQANPEAPATDDRARQADLHIDATLAAIDMSQYGTVFTLDNGQIWQTTSFGSLNIVPRVGRKVSVRSGPLGGFRLTLEGSTREVGVKRIK